MLPLSYGHCWLVQIEIIEGRGGLCVSLSSLLLRSRELLKVSVPYLPCAVAYNSIRNTGTLLGLLCCVSTCKQKIKSHTEQSREIKHGTSSLVICTPYQVKQDSWSIVCGDSYWLLILLEGNMLAL